MSAENNANFDGNGVEGRPAERFNLNATHVSVSRYQAEDDT